MRRNLSACLLCWLARGRGIWVARRVFAERHDGLQNSIVFDDVVSVPGFVCWLQLDILVGAVGEEMRNVARE